MVSVRVAIVGAGLAGLASAAALARSGHDVQVFEQADQLRASGLAINFWSNATSLLPQLGVPASAICGEPVSRMIIRASGRDVAVMQLPTRGLPHINVDRAPLLTALSRVLPDAAINYGTRCDDVSAIARDYSLVVVADGANSALREQIAGTRQRRWSWPIWQAVIDAELSEIPPGVGAVVVRAGTFGGIWRLTGHRIGWFIEQPARRPGTGAELLEEIRHDKDPLLRTLAQATSPAEWVEWLAQDIWPGRRLYHDNVVLVGDAAHAMLPTLGQGACQAIEDAAELAAAIRAEPTVSEALRRYQRRRSRRMRLLVALARAGAVSRRSSLISRAMPESTAARLLALTSGPIMRRLTSPNPALIAG